MNGLIKTYYNHPLSLFVRDRNLLTPSFFCVALGSVQIPMNCFTEALWRIIPKTFSSRWCRRSRRYVRQVFVTANSLKEKGPSRGLTFNVTAPPPQFHKTKLKKSGRFLPELGELPFWVGGDLCGLNNSPKIRWTFSRTVGDPIF